MMLLFWLWWPTCAPWSILSACLWAIPCQFSGSGQGTLSNFPEILLKLSLPHMMNIFKIWMKSVKKWH